MLSKVNHWIEIAGTAVDVLLLARVMLLKLSKTYLFITLACLLAVFFDGVSLWLGRDFARVFVYSRFLYAFVIPAAAYDVWEEMKGQIVHIRQMAIRRLVSSLILASVFGFVFVKLSLSDSDTDQTADLAVIVWAACITASLAFLWSMGRWVRAKKIPTPNNTFVWLIFFQFYLIAEVIACIYIMASSLFPVGSADLLTFALGVYEILLTVWCIWRLRPLSSSVPSTPAQASL
jgi:hypothetical protein